MGRKVRFLWFLLCTGVFLVTMPLYVSAAGVIDLPLTGQKKCYDSAGAVTACAGAGQDGELQKGIDWPAPRFSDTGNGSVTDNMTGLIWLKDANCIKTKYPGVNSSGLVYWSGALDFIDGINQGTYSDCGGGSSDWRLPNISEIQSLVHGGFYEELCSGSPCQYLKNWLESQGFLNVQAGDSLSYWTSTTYTETLDNCAGCSSAAYWIDMRSGSTGAASKSGQKRFVFPVRGAIPSAGPAKLWATGQTLCFGTDGPIDCASQGKTQDGAMKAGVSWTAPRVINNSDGTVSDPLTGLMWLKDSNCMKTRYPAVADDGLVTWNSGLLFVEGINNGTYPLCAAGYSDWRMPNMVEFRSLFSYYLKNPALPQGHPFENIEIYSMENPTRAAFWTSTSYSRSATYAFEANATDGTFYTTLKSYARGVWPVRGSGGGTPGPSIPTVTTSTVTEITSTTASGGGTVTSDGGSAVTSRGVCWATSASPTIAGSHTSDGAGSGAFTSAITALAPDTTFTIRAYATNAAGTGYGDDLYFSTLCPSDVAQIGTTGYLTLLEAIQNAGSGAEIKIREIVQAGPFAFYGTKTLSLNGGYNCVFTTVTGVTTVTGSITIGESAVVTMSNIAVY